MASSIFLGGGAVPQPLDTSDAPTFSGETIVSPDLGPVLTGAYTVGAGWTQSPAGTFTHASGTAGITKLVTTIPQRDYLVRFTVTGATAGSFTIILGDGAYDDEFDADDDYILSVEAGGAVVPGGLVFTPTADFDGVISAITVALIPESSALEFEAPAAFSSKRWQISAVPDDDVSNLVLMVRNAADDGWDSVAEFNAGGDFYSFGSIEGDRVTARDGFDAQGESQVQYSDPVNGVSFFVENSTEEVTNQGAAIRIRTLGDDSTGAAGLGFTVHHDGDGELNYGFRLRGNMDRFEMFNNADQSVFTQDPTTRDIAFQGNVDAASFSAAGSAGVTNAAVVGATATFNIKNGIIIGIS